MLAAVEAEAEYNGPEGARLKTWTLSTYAPEMNKITLELLERKISWGQWNTARKELYRKMQAEFRR